MIGSVVGKYRIEAELSRGGMGAVYVATHDVLQRKVAIKVLRTELTTSDEMVQRFVNEARAASAIRHPSIIEVHDFGYTDDGQAYLVMEYLEGQSLAHRLQQRGKLPEDEAVRIIRGISGALSAAHAKAIIHRDLKPDNIFMVKDQEIGERAKILDFGIAKLSESKTNTMTGALMGTPLYMAPEQARSAATIDHRADLYSLGCIFYELLTGTPPLVGEGAGEIIALHMFTVPDPPSAFVNGISPAIENIVMQLLEKEPGERFQSAAELSDALSNAYGRSSVLPATPQPPAALSKIQAVGAAPSLVNEVSARRSSNLPLLAGVGLALVGVAAVVIAIMAKQNADEPAPLPRVETERPIERAPVTQPAPMPTPPVQPAPTPAPPSETKAPVVETPRSRPVARPRPQEPAAPTHTRNASPLEPAP